MSGGHAHGLYLHRDSGIHRAPPQCKVASTLIFVAAVVATPREAVWAFAAYACAVAIWARRAEVPLTWLAKRLWVEAPVLLFAFFLPIGGGGPRVEVAGACLSIEGSWAAFNIVAKATLGLAATVLLAASTQTAELLHGLEHLKMPRTITAIAGFMVRYVDIISGEARRMRIARESRGYTGRWLWQGRAVASTAGTLFIRSFERGERVYVAMLSRGFDGSLPMVAHRRATTSDWMVALAIPALAVAVAVGAWAL